MNALVKANRVRDARADLCRDVRGRSYQDGARRVADLLVSYDDIDEFDGIGGLTVRRLLLAVRSFGEAKVMRIVVTVGIRSSDRRVRELTDRQRGEIALLLRGTA